MTAGTWGMTLLGPEDSRQKWADTFIDRTKIWVERDARNQEGTTHILRSASFANASTAEIVRDLSMPLVTVINGLMRLEYGCEPLTTSGVIFEDTNGRRHVTAFADTGVFTVRIGRVRAYAGTPEQIEATKAAEKNYMQLRVELAQTDQHIAGALHYLARPETWFDLYKAYEALRKIAKGEKGLEKLTGVSNGVFTLTPNPL